jgi:hypothetical protein
MKPTIILVSVLLTCANTLALAKAPKQAQSVKPELITTELDPQSKYVRLTKLFRLLGMKPKQSKTPKNDEFVLKEVRLVGYEIKEIKIYSF